MTECICRAAGVNCPPAKYEWLYTQEEMNLPGEFSWIPLCVECCAYWRKVATRPYKLRIITDSH